ncbi:MAG: hypothetical protein SCALA702_36430 [Melioribacteraceae bacterium]|nr:MAG: hypothetical protein SCALA702_36430 [Melioribacteraceae bacterium]
MNEDRYSRLIDYLTDYVYTVKIWDGEVVETEHGPGCYSVTGYYSDDYREDPKLWYRMVHEDDKEAVLEQANKALAGEEVNPLEHRIIHRDGSVKWVKNSIVLSKDGRGRVYEYNGLINDITGLRKAKEAADLRQKQLIQADKMATLGILIAGIAHEINNPNNFILLNVSLFTKIWEDIKPILQEYHEEHGDFVLAGMSYSESFGKVNDSLSGITSGAHRIQKIVRSLTHFARNDSGNLNNKVDLKSVIDNARLIAGNLIKNSTSNFSVDYPENIPELRGNYQQLEQVLINTINNACQALPDKTGYVKISVSCDEEKNLVIISIKDSGEGIPPEQLKHIFDPFFTTKREKGGTGLGLSISYHIIQNHGGSMEIESKTGEGTTCKITLPVSTE